MGLVEPNICNSVTIKCYEMYGRDKWKAIVNALLETSLKLYCLINAFVSSISKLDLLLGLFPETI